MKKFILSSDDLKKALKKVGQAINEKTVLPVLKNIYCKVGKEDVEFIASDLEISISYRCPIHEVGDQEPFELLLPYSFLHDIVAKMKNEPIIIEHPSTRKARIVCTEDKFEVNSLDKFEDFPKLPAIPKKNSIKLDVAFISLLTKCMHTVAKDESRPAMQRSLLEIKPGESYLASTDAHFLYQHKVNVETTETQAIQISTKMAKAIEDMEEVDLFWTDRQVAFKNEKLIVWCKMFDDKYPNYRQVIPTYGPNLAIDKNTLVEALERSCINSYYTKQTNLFLKKEEGFIFFETDDTDFSRKGTVRRPGVYTGETESISINAKKLLTILDQVEAEKIQLHIDKPTKAILISTEEDKDYLGLLMPLVL